MNWCRPHNRFHSEPGCPRCETRVVVEATRLPYRVTNPQRLPRCTRCGNLQGRDARGNPVCRCDGALDGAGALPSILRGLTL